MACIGDHVAGAITLITLRVRLSRMVIAVKISRHTARAITVRALSRDATKKPADIINVSATEFRMLSPA